MGYEPAERTLSNPLSGFGVEHLPLDRLALIDMVRRARGVTASTMDVWQPLGLPKNSARRPSPNRLRQTVS